ncbi:hypothetical protein D1BOALGB6SA_3338 [Olavius sp. associated proteobacterium Delta 1]|nr:hypothetical protein D1BOALGB6SA_3338 [Olavius sp. associated proteobacterium Delta 1]
MRFHNFAYLLIIVAFFMSVGNKAQANPIEKKFIDAGLDDVSTIVTSGTPIKL